MEIVTDIRFDMCGHNGDLACSACRVGVASCISLLWSYTRLSGAEHRAHKLARLLKRMKSVHGPLHYRGQHPNETLPVGQ
jgi:hypothetical protein